MDFEGWIKLADFLDDDSVKFILLMVAYVTIPCLFSLA